MSTRNHPKTILYVVLSSFLSALSIKVFIEAGQLFPGGFQGLSILIIRLVERETGFVIPFGVLYILFQIGPTYLVYRVVGKWFTRYSILQFLLVSFLVSVIPSMNITYDIFLISVFGGILSGLAASLALKGNASSGGTDFIALYISHKRNANAWNFIMYVNSGMLLIAGLLFSWEAALYSIIYQYVATQVVESLHQRYKLMSLRMFTEIPDAINTAILAKTRHGITILDGVGGYSKKKYGMLYMVVSAYEVDNIIKIAQSVDPSVFIDISKTERVLGNYYRTPLD